MEPITSIASEKTLDAVAQLVQRRVGYLYHYKDTCKELGEYHKNLLSRGQSVQHQVREAERNAEKIEADVNPWLEKVKQKITKIDEFLRKQGHAKTECSIGFFPKNLWLRYSLGRKAKKMLESLQSQNDELVNKKFDRVSHMPEPTAADTALFNPDYQSYASRKETLQNIMEKLKDPAVRMIGVYGLGGVGKTTLVKEVAKKAKEDNLFNMVVMANITRYPDIKKVQGQIADMLGLRLVEETEIGRAGRLRERLKNEKNILFVLDDFWTGLDLNKLGISFDDNELSKMKDDDKTKKEKSKKEEEKEKSRKDDDKTKKEKSKKEEKENKEKSSSDYSGCKILLTSRFKEVLSNNMEVQKDSIFLVKLLDEKEAETLFMKMAQLDESSALSSVAAKIAKKCEGLPMAIITVAKALRNKSQSEWNDALERLEKQKFTEVQDSIVFSTKLSYDHLEGKELKSTFLICAQMGHDPQIIKLLQYCIGLGIFPGVYLLREARNRLNTFIRKLKDSSLLLESYSNDCFTMHDIVRDAALSIASKEQHVLTLRNDNLNEWPGKDELERYTIISLHYCDVIDELPEVINCPRLKVFHVNNKDPSLTIPDTFFEGMQELRVLILTGIHLSPLPNSIKCLMNLRVLCLEECILGDNLSILGDLKKLRILSFSGSEIKSLPCGLSQLGKLQLFNISNCFKLRVIPSNLISSLKSLEELYMRNCLIEWGSEENHSQTASLAEFRHLHQLTTLDIRIRNAASMPRNLFLDKLEDYNIVIGDIKMFLVEEFSIPHMFEASRALALELEEGSNIHSQNWIKMLFKQVQKLILGELHGVNNLIDELNLEGFPCLEHLSIVNNSNIHYIINSGVLLYPLDAFRNLKSLYLYQLENLKKICSRQLTDVSFHQLKAIKIRACSQLKNLFPYFVVRRFMKLESIEVSESHSLEEIVAGDREETIDHGISQEKIEFPQLRSLTLRDLPKLISFYNKRGANYGPNSVSEITTEDEQDVSSSLYIFNSQVSIPNLENLELCSINISKICSDHSSWSFNNLVKLNVKDCSALTYLLSLSIAESLVNLKGLYVSGCVEMEQIFVPNMDGSKVRIFPKLEEMELVRMDRLTTIWYAQVSEDSFLNLGSVVIEDCGELVNVFPPHMVGRFQSVATLKVTNCESMKEIFDLEDVPKGKREIETQLRFLFIEGLWMLKQVWNRDPKGILNFNKLQKVIVDWCPDLENIFPVSVAQNLQNLEVIDVFRCDRMEEIVANEEGSITSETSITFSFPQVNRLSFVWLTKLERFYSGSHKLEWPALKDLEVTGCDSLEAFAIGATNEEGHPIFTAEKVTSNLEVMKIDKEGANWLQQFRGNCRMHNLKELWLSGVKGLDLIVSLLRQVPNLETLKLDDYEELEELVPAEGFSGKAKLGTVLQLKSLELSALSDLKNIGFEHDPVLQRIEHLVVEYCPLVRFVLSAVCCFTRLTYLEVTSCDGLINLMAASVAESLVQLMTMKVENCDNMEEVVSDEGKKEEKQVKIVFRKLTTLELYYLEKLNCFCNSSNHELHFPSLEIVDVQFCNRMETFAMGGATAPKLAQVYAAKVEEEGKSDWDADLNANIKKRYTFRKSQSQSLKNIINEEY